MGPPFLDGISIARISVPLIWYQLLVSVAQYKQRFTDAAPLVSLDVYYLTYMEMKDGILKEAMGDNSGVLEHVHSTNSVTNEEN